MMDPLVFVTPHAKLYYVWVLRLSNLQKQTKINVTIHIQLLHKRPPNHARRQMPFPLLRPLMIAHCELLNQLT